MLMSQYSHVNLLLCLATFLGSSFINYQEEFFILMPLGLCNQLGL